MLIYLLFAYKTPPLGSSQEINTNTKYLVLLKFTFVAVYK